MTFRHSTFVCLIYIENFRCLSIESHTHARTRVLRGAHCIPKGTIKFHINTVFCRKTCYTPASKGQSPPWEAISHWQQIPRLLWNPKVHYLRQPTTGPILSQKHPIRIFPSYFCKIYSNIIVPQTPVSSGSRPKLCTCFSSAMRATCSTQLILVGLVIMML